MTNADPTPDARALLQRTARMRALARRLVTDAAAADDLVQTALTRALDVQVVASDAVVAAAGGKNEWQRGPDQTVRGVAQPVPIWVQP